MPRKYGKQEKIVLVTSAPKPWSLASNLEQAVESETASEGPASQSNHDAPEGDSSHSGVFDDELDFSSSTSFRREALEPFKAKKVGSGKPSPEIDRPESRIAVPKKLPGKSKEKSPPIAAQPQISTSFIGEFGKARGKLDDLEFILDGLHPNQSAATRMSSTLNLAKLCKDPEMRALLRAHSLVEKVLDGLRAIPHGDGGIALAGSTALYFLCSDQANMELLNKAACQTIVTTMLAKPAKDDAGEAEEQSSGRVPLFKRRRIEEEKKKKADSESDVRQLIQDLMDSLGVPASLSDETKKELITPEHFMVMACTTISQHHAPFRDLFREVGGLTVCCNILTDSLLSISLDTKGVTTQVVPTWRLVRDLALIETLTHMNQANQTKLLEEHPDIMRSLVDLTHRLTGALRWLLKNAKDTTETVEEQQRRLGSCRLSALKTLVNLTNHNPVGCKQFGEAEGVSILLELLHWSTGKAGPEDHDCLTLGLGILINCTENNSFNVISLSSAIIIGGSEALEFLVSIFLGRIEEDKGRIAFDKMPVENLVIAAYTSVLLGCVLKDRADLLERVELALEGRGLKALGQVLEYFIVCHEEAAKGRGPQTEVDSLAEILDVLQKLIRSHAK